jgi:hypothetical protein
MQQTHTTALIPPAAPVIPLTLFGEPTLVGVQVEGVAGKCCGATVAELHAGAGPHAYELRCAVCGSHRGWLSRSTATWLHSLVGKYGMPSRPIHIKQQENQTMPFEIKELTGSLFRAEKDKPDDRDYSGQARLGDKLYWVSGFVAETKAGKKYLRLRFKPQQEWPADQGSRPPLRDELDDEIRF